MWIIVWIVLSVVVAVGADSRGRSGLGWLLFAFFLSPLVAGIALLIVGKAPAPASTAAEIADSTRTCPMCAETVKAAAIKCRFCGADLTPVQPAPAADPYSGA